MLTDPKANIINKGTKRITQNYLVIPDFERVSGYFKVHQTSHDAQSKHLVIRWITSGLIFWVNLVVSQLIEGIRQMVGHFGWNLFWEYPMNPRNL